ncbi:phospholipase [Rhizobiales bacterium RZME27]|uniref:Phospholipase n=1 Tax=Endobacterium cereale TaxID=2663029 RepID=A0A6A8A9I5_9HYPH|nr:acyl-CoA thioester hydrolase/BAAT C-terminal domain-containing protein [Endobacterium cereale]MEB2846715.1 acyl-CoA thioester hydrolase/BAAT C-terminal domain-containing protein [Endobacterium cereale]MQY46568.1 phospholipase [Endobacterium cereale]
MAPQDSLIIFFHGIGASGAQLMPLATSWREALPNSRFAAPDAPFPHWRGHQWFRIDGNPLAPENIQSARDGFNKTVSDIIRREGFEARLDRVAFVGVSQGAIVALDGVASGRWQVGALVSFAGLLAPMQVSSKSIETPVLLVHGQDDRTIPSLASTIAAGQLRAAGFNVEIGILPAVGHTISPGGSERGLLFLRKSLA